MKSEIHTGYLILADISGYTSYIAKSEIENAQALLAELLKRIVERFQSVVKISRLEGDAVFAYTTEPIRGEALMDLIESTYIAFREGQELFRLNLCECEACQSLPSLDLKFIVHYGSFAIQSVTAFQELVGMDVNVAHRLLKNHVHEKTNWRAYALISQNALSQMGISAEGMQEFREAYEHLGEIQLFGMDLTPYYDRWVDSKRILIDQEEADLIIKQQTELSPHQVWEWLTSNARRLEWEELNEIQRPTEQHGIGSESRCFGEGRAYTERVLDWKPFDYYSVLKSPQKRGRITPPMSIISTYKLHPLENGGTKLEIYCKVKTPMPAWLTQRIAGLVLQRMKVDRAYKRLLTAMQEK